MNVLLIFTAKSLLTPSISFPETAFLVKSLITPAAEIVDNIHAPSPVGVVWRQSIHRQIGRSFEKTD